MNDLLEFFRLILNSEEIISKGGLILVTLIVFAETGIFFCFFLPGDYLLFTAGMFCGIGLFKVHISILILCLATAAIAGNFTGYYFGKYLGNNLLNRKESFFFKRQYITNTERVFEKYGGNALIIGRFLPMIRTFAPILAGIIKFKPVRFAFYNISGALLWVLSICLLGYFLGKEYPQILDYVEYIILAFILLTSVAVFNSYKKLRKEHKENAINS
ncbi:MAG TPA: DedA family protein [Catalimonadaceae bacterium]|nr:DedA family protein [Catalimonadaceae bacterium]